MLCYVMLCYVMLMVCFYASMLPCFILCLQAHSSAGLSDLASRTFRRTIDSYKTAVLVCLNSIYKEIYGEDQSDILNIPGQPLLYVVNKRFLFFLALTFDFRIDPPPPPPPPKNRTVEGVVAIYERGCISAETMARFMMNSVNASPNDIETTRVKLLDKHFIKMLEVQASQAEANVASTEVTAGQKREKDAESGQGISKKMRIALERTSHVGGGST